MSFDHVKTNDGYNKVEVSYCCECNNSDNDNLIVVDYIDDVNVDLHPNYYFTYDDYYLIFTFTRIYKCNVECKENVELCNVYDVKKIPKILDKSYYNVNTWRKLMQHEDEENEELNFAYNISDLYIENDQVYNSDTEQVVTDEEANKILLDEYTRQADYVNQKVTLYENIMKCPDVLYNILHMYFHDDIGEYIDMVIFIYIERHHTLQYFTHIDCDVFNIDISDEFDEEVRYEYNLKDVFTLPHFIEVDGVEYVRIDIRNTPLKCCSGSVTLFTSGKILCEVTLVTTTDEDEEELEEN